MIIFIVRIIQCFKSIIDILLILDFCLPSFLGASVICWILFYHWPDLLSSLEVSLSLVSNRKYLSVCFLNLLIYKGVVIVICKIIVCGLVTLAYLFAWFMSRLHLQIEPLVSYFFQM
jgi:hypothetical protein